MATYKYYSTLSINCVLKFKQPTISK